MEAQEASNIQTAPRFPHTPLHKWHPQQEQKQEAVPIWVESIFQPVYA